MSVFTVIRGKSTLQHRRVMYCLNCIICDLTTCDSPSQPRVARNGQKNGPPCTSACDRRLRQFGIGFRHKALLSDLAKNYSLKHVLSKVIGRRGIRYDLKVLVAVPSVSLFVAGEVPKRLGDGIPAIRISVLN